MADDQAEDPRARQNKLLERLGTALLGLSSKIDAARSEAAKAHTDQLAQGNAHLTQMALVVKALEDLDKLDAIPQLMTAIAEARKDIERVDRSVDDARRELTPVHGTPLADRQDVDKPERPESIELGPVRVPVRTADAAGRALPWIVAGFLFGCAMIIVALWLSGARLIVTEPASASTPPPPGATHLVPPLPVPHEP